MKKFISRRALVTLIIILSICSTGVLIFNACNKPGNKDPFEIQSIVRKKFFSVPDDTHPIVKAIAQNVELQDKQRNFLNALTENAGYPIWDKAMIAKKDAGSPTSKGSGGGEVVLIPFVKEGAPITNAILIANTSPELKDTIFNLVYASRYEDFGFDYSDTTRAGAKNIFHLFSVFDNQIFGHTQFVVDRRILTGDLGDVGQETTVTLKNGPGTSYKNVMISVTYCNDYEVCNSCSGGRTSSMMVIPCPCGSHIDIHCTSVLIYGGGGGIGSGSGSGTGGSTGGGGGGWENENPCRAIPGQDTNPCNGTNPQPGGWTPVVAPTWAGMPKLCTNYDFVEVGNSYTVSIKYLQQIWAHNAQPYERIWTNFVESCLTIPKYGINPAQASQIFNDVFNSASNTVLLELNAGKLAPASYAITARLKQLIQTRLARARRGAVWNTNLCSGADIPATEAGWCP
jgi:hypothetical protein